MMLEIQFGIENIFLTNHNQYTYLNIARHERNTHSFKVQSFLQGAESKIWGGISQIDL